MARSRLVLLLVLLLLAPQSLLPSSSRYCTACPVCTAVPGSCTGVQITLNFNGLTSIDPTWFTAACSGYTVLYFGTNSITSLPSGVFDTMPQLTALQLNFNDITFLPARVFDALVNLQTLYLNSNSMSNLPAGIFDNMPLLTTCLMVSNPWACSTAPSGFTAVPAVCNVCAGKIEQDVSCRISPCENGGACADGMGSYTCNCAGTGFNGSTCQDPVNECLSAPCLNGGNCTDGDNTYTCSCAGTGFAGSMCQININDCLPTSCQGGGICIDGVNTFTCESSDDTDALVMGVGIGAGSALLLGLVLIAFSKRGKKASRGVNGRHRRGSDISMSSSATFDSESDSSSFVSDSSSEWSEELSYTSSFSSPAERD